MNEIRRKCCCDPCCSCKYRRRWWARWWAVRRRCRRSPGRRRTSALRPCAAAAAAAARPDDAAVRTASSGSSFAAKVLKRNVTIRWIHDDIRTIYLTEWAWSDGYLIEGHGRYHGDAGTGDEPAQNVGPFRVHVTVVLQRPVVVQSVADDSLKFIQIITKNYSAFCRCDRTCKIFDCIKIKWNVPWGRLERQTSSTLASRCPGRIRSYSWCHWRSGRSLKSKLINEN